MSKSNEQQIHSEDVAQCPKGGEHVPVNDDDGLFCQNCFEPLKEELSVTKSKKTKTAKTKKPAVKKEKAPKKSPAKKGTHAPAGPPAKTKKPAKAKQPVESEPQPVEAPAPVKEAVVPKKNPEKPLSLKGAALAVLAELNEPLTVRKIYDEITARNLWASPAGKTPTNTLSTLLITEIAKRGDQSRVKKVGKGLFQIA